MAYDRYESRRGSRDPSRFQDDRFRDRDSRDRDPRSDRGERDERGFFERAGEHIASWFGDEDDEERYSPDRRPNERERERGRDQDGWRSSPQPQGWGTRTPADRDYGDRAERGDRQERGGYRPVTGDHGRSESPWGRDDYRRTSFAGSGERGGERGASRGSERGQSPDPHYQQWRQRQLDELDRDYDDYRREHQSKFENDFGSWRTTRQTKRQMLGSVREQMEVVGSDDEHVGTVDKVAGDRIILTKSDEAAGGVHHSLGCTDVERIDGDKLVLSSTADEARKAWREERERPTFDRDAFDRDGRGESDGSDGPHMLDRSFSGTYR